jgi:hypothetical protein
MADFSHFTNNKITYQEPKWHQLRQQCLNATKWADISQLKINKITYFELE